MSRSFWMWGVGTHKSTINILKLFNRIRSVKRPVHFQVIGDDAVFFYAMEDVMEEIKSIRISELKDFKNHPFMYSRTWKCVL